LPENMPESLSSKPSGSGLLLINIHISYDTAEFIYISNSTETIVQYNQLQKTIGSF